MKQLIYSLLLLLTMVTFSTTLTSCGDDEPNGTETPNTPANEQLAIDEESLTGTWRFTASDYINTDYIAFDGRGNGMMAIAADQFHNSEYIQNDGAFGLVTFKYYIENNIIYIMPDRNHIKDFIITVFDVQRTSIDVLFDLDIPHKRKTMRLYQDDWEWFIKDGPASVDLTGSYPGNYTVDNDPMHKIQVTRINNFTLKVNDIYKNTEVTGVLYWHEIYGSNTSGNITLWRPNDTMDAGYWFTSDGKLHSMAGNHYFSGGASKSDESNISDNTDKVYDDSNILGTWEASSVTDYTIDLSYTKVTITFLSDGTVIEKDIPVDEPTNYETYTGNYTQKGKILYYNMPRGIMYNYFEQDCTISELSATWLQFSDSHDSSMTIRLKKVK